MDLIKAVILGIVQAITEFLPISSSGHLILFRDWLNLVTVDGLTFDVALHFGTLVALLVYFHRDLRRLIAGTLGRLDEGAATWRRLAIFLVAATIPAALAGFFLDDYIESMLRRPEVVAVTLVLGGLLFLWVERVAARSQGTIEQVSFPTAMGIGVAQCLALVPGVSRSGITISTAMLMGMSRAEAARFSFLLAIPIMLGASLKKAIDLGSQPLDASQVPVVAAGVVTAALGGWVVIRFLLRFLRSRGLNAFAYYRFALALVILVWLAL